MKALFLLSLMLGPLPAMGAGLLAVEKPNVLIVLVDDFGWGDLGANGGAGVPPPP